MKEQTKKQSEQWYKDMEDITIRAKYEQWVKKEQERFDKAHRDTEEVTHGA